MQVESLAAYMLETGWPTNGLNGKSLTMPLESLHTLIESLKERIATHNDALRASEALTRYALINPLLRELGWDTANPALVLPEYESGKGRADYALLGCDGKPAMMVEAKKLGSPLRDDAPKDSRAQALLYCLMEGTGHFALTDGGRWDIYETNRQGTIDEKLVAEFDLIAQSAADVCLVALALWRPSLEVGEVVPGHAPLIQPKPAPSPAPQPAPVPPPDELEWRPLSELEVRKHDPPPTDIRFPDKSRQAVRHWKDVAVGITQWLAKNDSLLPSHCPIRRGGKSKLYLVSSKPVHESGKAFISPRQIDSMYMETNFSVVAHIKNTRTVIAHVGENPAKFELRFK